MYKRSNALDRFAGSLMKLSNSAFDCDFLGLAKSYEFVNLKKKKEKKRKEEERKEEEKEGIMGTQNVIYFFKKFFYIYQTRGANVQLGS